MRKDSLFAKNIIDVKATYDVQGLNLDRLINFARSNKITLINAKKISNKRLIVSVSLRDSVKFFAIAKNLCYNIKKIKETGKGYPLLALSRSLGLFLGAIVFIFSSYFYSDVILDFNFTGSGSVYEREVIEYLENQGVKKLSRFSKYNLERLEDGILADNPRLSFVSLNKRGNVLVVDTALSTDGVDRLSGNVFSIKADCDGVVEKIKVFRGTAVVQVGDTVKKGDLLVDGFVAIKEQKIDINVLALITLRVRESVDYISNIDEQEQIAILFAEAIFSDKNVLEYEVKKTVENDRFIYTVTAQYLKTIYAG